MMNIEAKLEEITPDVAKAYLEHNKRNRKIKTKTVESYARDIMRGNFVTTHQGIAFNNEGELIDGQHRLLAIVAANKSVQMMVTRGLPNGTVSVLDRGVSRSIRDVIQMEMLHDGLDDGMFTNPKIISGLSHVVSGSYKMGMRLSSDDMKNLFNEFIDVLPGVYDQVVTKAGSKARAPMIAAAISAAACGVDADTLGKFFSIFFKDDVAGCDNYNIQAVLNWKRQLDVAKQNKVTMDRKRFYLGTQNAIYHFVNNTDVKRIVAPSNAVYDVSDRVKSALLAN